MNFLSEFQIDNNKYLVEDEPNIGSSFAKYSNLGYECTILNHNMNIARFIDERILPFRNFVISKYCDYFYIDKDEFLKNLIFIIICHDIGKANKNWQQYILGKVKLSGIRHEFHCFKRIFKYQLERIGLNSSSILDNEEDIKKYLKEYYFIFFPIFAHHSNLSKDFIKYFYSNNKKPILFNNTSLLNEFLNVTEYIDNNVQGESLDIWYKQQIYRYFLSIGDKMSSAFEENDTIVLPSYSLFNFNDIYNGSYRGFQQDILDNADEQALIVRVPTGGGKTYASSLWANHQIKNGRADRAIIAMPTQFTSNSLGKDIQEYVEDTNVYHGNIKDLKYFDLKFIKTLESTFSITTIDQLLNSLQLFNEDAKNTLFNIVNSCVIIDEIDFYSEFIICNIIKLLKVLCKFNVRFIIMSATISDTFIDIFNKELGMNIKVIENKENNDKTRISINKIYDNEDFIFDKIKNVNNCIIYCNTVRKALHLYDEIKKIRDDVYVYHSKIRSIDKQMYEDNIINTLGKKVWENNDNPNGIVILTQIGELSLNISSDNIITYLAPFDKMVQRFGRGCRFNDKICNVDVILLKKDNGEYDYLPYSTEKKCSVFFSRTAELIKETTYSYSDYINLINEIYFDFKLNDKSIENSKLLDTYQDVFKLFSCNKYLKIDEEIGLVGEWRCRDIELNYPIYINDNLFLDNEININCDKELYELKNKYTVTINMFLFEKLKKNNILISKTFLIKDKEFTIYVLSESYYFNTKSSLKGLDINLLDEKCRCPDIFI